MKKLTLIMLFLGLSIFTAYGSPVDFNQKAINTINQTNHTQNSFSFVVMGDNRDGNNVLEKIISKINQDKSIGFSINNGDLVPEGYKKQFKTYLNIIKKSNKPLVSIIGNHELPWYDISDDEKNYKDLFGKTNFSFSYGNSYFLVLDTSDKQVTKEQKDWLIKQLKISQNYTNRFVFTHVPLYDPREGEYAKGHSLKKLKQAKELNDLFDKYKVTMLFCSHIHFYYKGEWQNTPFIITGGAGAPLKNYKHNGFYHYVKVMVNGKDIEYKVVKIDTKSKGLIDQTTQSIKDFLNLN